MSDETIQNDEQQGERPRPKQQVDPADVFRQMYGSKRAIIDTSVPPVLFVLTNSFLGLTTAAIISAGYGLATAAYRALRKQQFKQALFGLGGLGIALAIALRTGKASNYFLPNVISGFALAAAAIVSVFLRKPLTLLMTKTLEGKPDEHYERPLVRAAHSVVTLGWGLWFAVRSGVRSYFIATDQPEALGVTAVALGTPATIALVVVSFAYIRWRTGAERAEDSSG